MWTRFAARKIPTANRIFVVLALVTLSSAASARTVNEAEVVRIVRTRDPEARAAREAASEAEADEVRASLHPNPSIGWQREHEPSGAVGAERQDSVTMTVPIDVTGRRPAEMALARAGAASAKARAARTQSEAVTRALVAFYEALSAQREVRVVSRTVARLREAARVMGRRRTEGSTSGYESARLEIEAELAESELAQARARAAIARTRLASLLGIEARTLELRGDFSTVRPASRRTPPSLAFARRSQAEASDARDAARWAWIPSLSASGGVRIRESTETHYGYIVGLSLSLPFFSHGQELIAESTAKERVAAAEARAAERNLELEEASARTELAAARQELARFHAQTRERVAILERAATSGYREGERSVVELVDVERLRTQVERRRLELELTAKRAEIAWRAARGEFE